MVALTPDDLLIGGGAPLEDGLDATLFADEEESDATFSAGGESLTSEVPLILPSADSLASDSLEARSLSPASDPAGGELAMQSMSYPPGGGGVPTSGTINVSATPGNNTNEALPTSGSSFVLHATASSYTGPPPSTSVTVNFSRAGSASASSDYNGPLATTTSVTITLTNGMGSTSLGYSEIDDALDEGDETAGLALTNGTAANGFNVVVSTTPVTSTIIDNDQWAAGDPITGTITTSAGDNPEISINSTLSLTLNATDVDMSNSGGYWAPFVDDVTSGTTEADHHIRWEASEGTFVNPYGTNVTYLAPDYVEGPLEREVTITATVDDFNRGGDVLGFNDAALQMQRRPRVRQVRLTVKQGPGNVSGNYNGPPLPDSVGGGKLGWITPGQPQNATGYWGATEIKGELSANAPAAGYSWVQEKRGYKDRKVNGAWGDPPSFDEPDWVPDAPPPGFVRYDDVDPRSPNGPDNPDVRQIFLLDTPGWGGAGAQNNGFIAEGMEALIFDMTYSTSVHQGGVRVSNFPIWDVDFNLIEQDGVWVPVGGHTP